MTENDARWLAWAVVLSVGSGLLAYHLGPIRFLLEAAVGLMILVCFVSAAGILLWMVGVIKWRWIKADLEKLQKWWRERD